MLLGQKLATTAGQNGSKVAFRYLAKPTTYKDAYSYINRYSYFLQNEIQHNKKVMIYMSNCPHIAYTFFALSNTKNIAIFADPSLPEQKLADRIRDLQIDVIIVSDDYLTRAKELVKNHHLNVPVIQCEQRRWGEYDTTYRLPVSMSASDTDVVAYFETQGTTGKPKTVAYTHAMIQQAALILRAIYRISSIDNFFTFQMPLGHPFYFMHGLIVPFINGATVTISDLTAAEELAQELLDAKVTRMILRGAIMEELLNSFKSLNLKIPTLRSLTPDYSALNPSVAQLAKTDYNDCKILNCYGSVETCWAVASRQFEDPEPFGSVGQFLSGTKIRVIDENGDDLPPGKQKGQLLVSGGQVATGYLNNKDATKLNMRGAWFFTGDYVEVDKMGVVKFLDRKDNICHVARQFLVPSEIEKKILECPGVAQTAVISIKDALGKFMLLAIIVKKLGMEVSAADVQTFCEAHLTEGERPRSVAFMPEFPIDSHGLINKYRLRFEFSTT
jgi:acyl-CoA synthetase (AMP-forming)/AMP-acid ligase II